MRLCSCFFIQESCVGERLTDTVVQQMEDFAAKLLRDEIAVYNKRMKQFKLLYQPA